MPVLQTASVLSACLDPWSAVTLALFVCLMPLAVRSVVGRGRDAHDLGAGKRPAASRGEDGRVVFVNAAPCSPSGVASCSNAPEPCAFDSGVCFGEFLCLHKPTCDPVKLSTGDYPYADHMHHRKRLWEFRLQLTFREKVEGEFFFGAEQDKYYPVGTAQRYISDAVNSMLRRAASGMYQSHGDDPARTEGEAERPALVFPLWVMDQLIVTPAGETPPDLTDGKFANLGRTKADSRGEMRRELTALRFEEGETYTFGFWCVSQFVDAIAWSSRTPVAAVQLSELGTHPPAFITLYALKPREQWGTADSRDTRHLDSRKTYLWRAAFWSSNLPPSPARAAELLAPSGQPQVPAKLRGRQEAAAGSRTTRSCCSFIF